MVVGRSNSLVKAGNSESLSSRYHSQPMPYVLYTMTISRTLRTYGRDLF